MVFVDTSENPAPATHWMAWDNNASHNNLACAAEQGGGAPALSGIGITLFVLGLVMLVAGTVLDRLDGMRREQRQR